MSDSDPFSRLSDLLSEMQAELASPSWPEERRITRTADFRLHLFEAICDYRDQWIKAVRPEKVKA